MARLRRTARKSVPGGPYRVEGFRFPEQVVVFLSEHAPRRKSEKIQWVICRFPAGIDIVYLIIFWGCHIERGCNVVYAHLDKEVERAYGVWLRAPGQSGKQNVGARWMRSVEGGGRWTEYSGGVKRQTKESGSARDVARFKELNGMVRENSGD
ncbi:hypothetical protein AgCh_016781 [Apium graveolens]